MNPTLHAAAVVRIRLEEGECVLSAGGTLADLLAQLGHAPASVATAVDGTFVPRARRADCVLQDGQQLLLFRPIVGG